MTRRRILLVLLAVILAAFVTLYPYWDCGPGECPEAAQLSHAASAASLAACIVAVLVAASYASIALAPLFRGRRCDGLQRPAEVYLPPDPRPPRPFL